MNKKIAKKIDRLQLTRDELLNLNYSDWLESVNKRSSMLIRLHDNLNGISPSNISKEIELRDIFTIGRPDISLEITSLEGGAVFFVAKNSEKFSTFLDIGRGKNLTQDDKDEGEILMLSREKGGYRDVPLPGMVESKNLSWWIDFSGDFRYFKTLSDLIDWLGTIGDVVRIEDQENALEYESQLSSATNVISLNERFNSNDKNNSDDKLSDNIPALDSPVYPKPIIGDSAIPLQGQFHESEYKDDNYIGNTWKALINSYYS